MFNRRSLPEPIVYEILANPRRRGTIQHLTETAGGRVMSLRDLSAAIATEETGQSPPPSACRESVYNSLHQTHLPKLEELGVVEYDRETRAVRIRNSARAVERYMQKSALPGLRWEEYYRGLGIAALVTVVAALANVPGIGAVDPLLWASGFLCVFALSTGYQLWSLRWYLRQLPHR